MLTTLAFDLVEQSMFRQLLEPIAFTTATPDMYTSSQLTQHLDNKHSESDIKTVSSQISALVLDYQVVQGLSSDWITDGLWLADIDIPSLFTVSDLTYPGVGGAWLYFSDERYTWVTVQYQTNTQFWVNDDTGINVYWDKPSEGSATDRVYVSNFNGVNVTIGNLNPTTLPNSFVEFIPDRKWEANPIFITQNPSYLRPSDIDFVRTHYLDADILPLDSTGLYDESITLANPLIQEATSHIQDASIHIQMSDEFISESTSYPSYYIRYALNYNLYLYNGFSGDAWYDELGRLQSPQLTDTLESYWIAFGNNGGYVRHPDTNEVIAAPVNNKKEVRCSFTLPLGLMPVADPDIVLRCLNPGLGNSLITDLLVPE